MLRAAVGGLQGDAAVRERGAHLNDRAAVARQHAFECRQRPVDDAEIGHLRHPFDFVRLQLLDRGEDRHHRVVDPDIDRTELTLHPVRRRLDLLGTGHIGRQHQRASPLRFHLASCALETVDTACEQADVSPLPRECPNRGATDARRRSGDHDHLFHRVRSGEVCDAMTTGSWGAP